jgi:glycosyltransferase involved in cell wall biosynthesis
MSVTDLTWQAHRRAIDSLGVLLPFDFRSPGRRRLLFITESDPLCHAQFFPFWQRRTALLSRYSVEIRELPMERFLDGRNPYTGPVDAVCFQAGFDLSLSAVAERAARIRNVFPDARLAYFDGSATTDLRYAEVLAPCITVYVKKQALRDRGRYGEPALGGTPLADYYARRYGLAEPETRLVIPESFWSTLWLGPPVAYSAEVLPYFRRGFPNTRRTLDLNARLGVQGAEWYSQMRAEALEQALALEHRYQVACRGRVARKAYLAELFRSRLCFSPFGHGEIGRRDFEAIFAGSLLLKPDLSHLETAPEIFRPYETYVPLAWDFSDLEEKVEHYLKHTAEREAIARRAFDLLRGYFGQKRFLDDVEPLFTKLGLYGSERAAPAMGRVWTGGPVVPRGPRTGPTPAGRAGQNPKVLLSAYRCGPGEDGEARIGWEWYRRLAGKTPVILVTHARNRAALEQAGAPLPGSEVFYIDTQWFANLVSKRGESPTALASLLDYYLYDREALGTLRRCRKAGAAFDVAHQPTPVAPSAVTKLHRLGVPLLLGPWNGGLAPSAAFPERGRGDGNGTYPHRRLGKLADGLRGTTRKAGLILTATQATRAGLPAVCRDRCRPMPEHGVDLDVFPATPWPNPPSATEPLRVLFAGPLEPVEGAALLLEAVARAGARSPVHLTLAGTGSEEAALRAQAESLELSDRVRFAGALAPAGMAEELAQAHVFCRPSARAADGAAPLEARPPPRPVVALDYGCPAEIVDDNVGLLIPATGPRAVVERLTWALIDTMNAPEIWRLRGKAARTRVERHYSWEAKIDAALALYREMLGMP